GRPDPLPPRPVPAGPRARSVGPARARPDARSEGTCPQGDPKARGLARLRGMTSYQERTVRMFDSSSETRRGSGDSARERPRAPAPPPAPGPRDAAADAPTPRRWRRVLPRLIALLLLASAASGGTWYYLKDRKPADGRLVLEGNIDVRQVNLAFKVDGRI